LITIQVAHALRTVWSHSCKADDHLFIAHAASVDAQLSGAIAAVMRIAVEISKSCQRLIFANPSKNLKSKSEKMKPLRRDSEIELRRREL
jgi:hypothetical protein